MRKRLKRNHGFSMVELLVALLILAIVSAAAIMLFGGVLDTGRTGADRERADNIRRAIMTYMAASGDVNLSCLGGNGALCSDVVTRLSNPITIQTSAAGARSVTINPAPAAAIVPEAADYDGAYGSYLDAARLTPQNPQMNSWRIIVNSATQVVQVTPSPDAWGANTITVN
jgi:prepilin-type N-terminal cleavage/methylation domain-containing protein